MNVLFYLADSMRGYWDTGISVDGKNYSRLLHKSNKRLYRREHETNYGFDLLGKGDKQTFINAIPRGVTQACPFRISIVTFSEN